MECDDLNQITDFLFDESTPESDQEIPIVEESHVAAAPPNPAPRGRITRRRARKACMACHKRKVRCDALAGGHACTNCRLDDVKCVFRSSGKRLQSEGIPEGKVRAIPRMGTIGSQSPVLAEMPRAGSPFAVDTIESRVPALETTPANPALNGISSRPNDPVQTSSQTDLMFAYFDFIETEPLSHIEPEDFKFLEHKGCFHLPQRPILDDLVQQYFLHVHPILPVIDEQAFWEIYLPSGRQHARKKIPLFVFRAMLFASCSFASDDTIRKLGFRNAIEGRSCLYRRTKLLYDFDTTSDPITLSQGSLILTYYTSERECLANTSWLRLAIQYANSVNVPMYEQDKSISSEERLRRKRLWWCLILRDRVLSLGLRRPIQITRDSFDFSQPKITEKELEPEFSTSRVYNRETKRDLAQIFLAQLDLAVELTDTLACVYPSNGFRSFDLLDYNNMQLMPSRIERCKKRLDMWHSKFTETLPPGAWPDKHKSISLYIGLTSMYYHAARAALCQFETFMLQADDSQTNDFKMKELGSTIHSSVASISETVRDFVQLDLAKYLPISAAAYLALPIIMNSLDLENLSPTNVRTEAKRRQLLLLYEAMDIFKKRYCGADMANGVIKKTIEDARSEKTEVELKVPNSSSLVYPSAGALQDCFEAFVLKPQQYLRVTFLIDFSLSLGRYPDRKDFPRQLSSQTRLIPNNSIPKSLMPVENFQVNTGSMLLEPIKNTFLDFFDFSEPQDLAVPDGRPWNGQTVDNILEEILGEGGRPWDDVYSAV